MRVNFTIPGKPQGKARARTYHTSSGVRTVTPEKTVLYENLIKGSYLIKYKKRMFDQDQPLIVMIEAVFEPPRSASKKKQQEMIEKKLFPTKKPDSDNIAKVVLDAMNGTVYPDDKQVIGLIVQKVYGKVACVNVIVEG